MIGFEPYKGRHIDPDKRVRVYRNLMRTGAVWYSVMQGGVVIGHVRKITLERVVFIVREAGRLRCLRDKRKNVHAFVDGYVNDSAAIDGLYGPVAVSYYPFRAPFFEARDGALTGTRVDRARVVSLNATGCHAFAPDGPHRVRIAAQLSEI